MPLDHEPLNDAILRSNHTPRYTTPPLKYRTLALSTYANPKFIQSCKFCAILLAKGRKGGIICGVKTARSGGKPSNK